MSIAIDYASLIALNTLLALSERVSKEAMKAA